MCALKVIRKLGNGTPSAELVDGYLHEIAKAYSVDWSPPSYNTSTAESDGGGDGGVQVSADTPWHLLADINLMTLFSITRR